MDEIIKIVEWIEQHPVVGTAILACIGYTIVGLTKSFLKLIKKNKVNIKPTFYTLGKRYKIHAVHLYRKSEDISGYDHISQNSRPDQWQKLIRVESSFLNLRHKVVPLNKDDILTIIISRNGIENEKVIEFNK